MAGMLTLMKLRLESTTTGGPYVQVFIVVHGKWWVNCNTPHRSKYKWLVSLIEAQLEEEESTPIDRNQVVWMCPLVGNLL